MARDETQPQVPLRGGRAHFARAGGLSLSGKSEPARMMPDV